MSIVNVKLKEKDKTICVKNFDNSEKIIYAKSISNKDKFISVMVSDFKYRAYLKVREEFLISVNKILSSAISHIKAIKNIGFKSNASMKSETSLKADVTEMSIKSTFDGLLQTALTGESLFSIQQLSNLASIKYRVMSDLDGLDMSDVDLMTMSELYIITLEE